MHKFGYGLIVELDGAPYFQSSVITDLVTCDDYVFISPLAYLPEIIRLKNAGNRCKQCSPTDSLVHF